MAMPARLLDGQLQQVQRALHVDLVGGLGHELRPRREQRGQVEDRVDLELAAEPVEQVAIEDVAREADRAPARQLGIERPDVEGQDVDGPALRDLVDQAVAISPLAPVTRTTGLRVMLASPAG